MGIAVSVFAEMCACPLIKLTMNGKAVIKSCAYEIEREMGGLAGLSEGMNTNL